MSSPSFPRVAILVLNYRGKDCLLPCLSSLEKLTYPETDVIVIDNASGDGSLETAQLTFPLYTFLALPNNRGFAAGMNAGIALARSRGAEYFWLFNNDALAEAESLSLLMKVSQKNPEAGLLSPLIKERDREAVWFARGRINIFRMRAEHVPPPVLTQDEECYQSEYLSGCALLIRRSVIDRVGFLDEAFFLYYEDADYSLRVQSAGFTTLVVPKALVRHAERSRINDEKLPFLVYSGLLFFGKHASPFQRIYLVLYVTIRRIKNALDRLLGKKKAFEIAKAYRKYFHDHSPLLFPYLR